MVNVYFDVTSDRHARISSIPRRVWPSSTTIASSLNRAMSPSGSRSAWWSKNHDAGLLEPSDVDPETGYRYYSVDQLPVAQVIRRLRNLKMPVAEVKAVIETRDADTRNRLIATHLDRLESELTRTRAAVGELRDLLEPPPTHPVEHRTVPPTPAIAIQETIDREDVFPWWQGAIGELTASAHAQGLAPTVSSPPT